MNIKSIQDYRDELARSSHSSDQYQYKQSPLKCDLIDQYDKHKSPYNTPQLHQIDNRQKYFIDEQIKSPYSTPNKYVGTGLEEIKERMTENFTEITPYSTLKDQNTPYSELKDTLKKSYNSVEKKYKSEYSFEDLISMTDDIIELLKTSGIAEPKQQEFTYPSFSENIAKAHRKSSDLEKTLRTSHEMEVLRSQNKIYIEDIKQLKDQLESEKLKSYDEINDGKFQKEELSKENLTIKRKLESEKYELGQELNIEKFNQQQLAYKIEEMRTNHESQVQSFESQLKQSQSSYEIIHNELQKSNNKLVVPKQEEAIIQATQQIEDLQKLSMNILQTVDSKISSTKEINYQNLKDYNILKNEKKKEQEQSSETNNLKPQEKNSQITAKPKEENIQDKNKNNNIKKKGGVSKLTVFFILIGLIQLIAGPLLYLYYDDD